MFVSAVEVVGFLLHRYCVSTLSRQCSRRANRSSNNSFAESVCTAKAERHTL